MAEKISLEDLFSPAMEPEPEPEPVRESEPVTIPEPTPEPAAAEEPEEQADAKPHPQASSGQLRGDDSAVSTFPVGTLVELTHSTWMRNQGVVTGHVRRGDRTAVKVRLEVYSTGRRRTHDKQPEVIVREKNLRKITRYKPGRR